MSGKSITTTGSDSSSSTIVNDLRQATSQFTEKITAHAPQHEIVNLSQSIEGNLLNLQVLGQISKEFCDKLVKELHSLADQ